MKAVLSVFSLAICCSLLISCSNQEKITRTQGIMDQFNKSKFIEGITQKRTVSEEYVKRLKSKNKTSEALKSSYAEVERGYNDILGQMIIDINQITNIADFATFSGTQRYLNQLISAEAKETKFINNAYDALNLEGSFLGNLFNTIISFVPGVSQVQNAILNALKAEITLKLNNSKFRNWDSIH